MKKILLIATILFACSVCNYAEQPITESNLSKVGFTVTILQPTKGTPGPHRSPILLPDIYFGDGSLFFYTSCDGDLLELINKETDEVAYSVYIPVGTEKLRLPAGLSGEYALNIIRGNYCFSSYLEL